MDQRAVQHPRHDLHVAMRMGLEPGSGRDGVVVADDEPAMVGVGAQRVDSRVERVASVQPVDPGLMAIRAATDAHARASDRGRTHASLPLYYLILQVKACNHNRLICQGRGGSRADPGLALPPTVKEHAEKT